MQKCIQALGWEEVYRIKQAFQQRYSEEENQQLPDWDKVLLTLIVKPKKTKHNKLSGNIRGIAVQNIMAKWYMATLCVMFHDWARQDTNRRREQTCTIGFEEGGRI